MPDINKVPFKELLAGDQFTGRSSIYTDHYGNFMKLAGSEGTRALNAVQLGTGVLTKFQDIDRIEVIKRSWEL